MHDRRRHSLPYKPELALATWVKITPSVPCGRSWPGENFASWVLENFRGKGLSGPPSTGILGASVVLGAADGADAVDSSTL